MLKLTLWAVFKVKNYVKVWFDNTIKLYKSNTGKTLLLLDEWSGQKDHSFTDINF